MKVPMQKILLAGMRDEQEEILLKMREMEILHLENLKAADFMQQDAIHISECSKFAFSRETFLATGWVPKKRLVELESLGISWQEIEADDGEEAPILLENSRIIRPFELITSLFSLPKSNEFDPTFILACFYFLFFGIIVADAGYGLVLAVLCPLIIRFKKPKGQARLLLGLLGICGVSSIIWGLAFGSIFGDALPVLLKIPFAPWLLDPINQSILFLIGSFSIGMIHLIFGFGIKIAQEISARKKNPIIPILQNAPWIIILLSLPLIFIDANLAKWIIIGAFAVLFLAAGIGEGNILRRVLAGFGELYGIIGILSDILSYSRFLALGLAGIVISVVVNTLGEMVAGNGVFGIVALILVFLIGHLINIAIGCLGAFVHVSRLQYVEYFSKFYEGGGRAFKPLAGTDESKLAKF